MNKLKLALFWGCFCSTFLITDIGLALFALFTLTRAYSTPILCETFDFLSLKTTEKLSILCIFGWSLPLLTTFYTFSHISYYVLYVFYMPCSQNLEPLTPWQDHWDCVSWLQLPFCWICSVSKIDKLTK